MHYVYKHVKKSNLEANWNNLEFEMCMHNVNGSFQFIEEYNGLSELILSIHFHFYLPTFKFYIFHILIFIFD